MTQLTRDVVRCSRSPTTKNNPNKHLNSIRLLHLVTTYPYIQITLVRFTIENSRLPETQL